MILINFSHPLTDEQLTSVETLTGRALEHVIDVPAQFDEGQSFAKQVVALVDTCDLTATEWQQAPILIIPPALSFIAVLLVAELHGRMGYFPPCVRTRPVAGSAPRRYEVAEVMDLQAQRDAARGRRSSDTA
jgi:hypothetical protein